MDGFFGFLRAVLASVLCIAGFFLLTCAVTVKRPSVQKMLKEKLHEQSPDASDEEISRFLAFYVWFYVVSGLICMAGFACVCIFS